MSTNLTRGHVITPHETPDGNRLRMTGPVAGSPAQGKDTQPLTGQEADARWKC
jgi:hypothetical protein